MTREKLQEARSKFEHFVDAEVRDALTNNKKSFASLLWHTPSVYPTEILASINRLAAMDQIQLSLAETIRQEASTNRSERSGAQSLLPLPHPLDFEWRFAANTSRDLLNLANDLTPPGGRVLLFGTPGVAAEALSLPISRQMLFLGEKNSVTQRLIALNEATGSPLSIDFCNSVLPVGSANAVIVDPPWYMDFIRPMLKTAAAACRAGGVVILSLPSAGTRPSAISDRAATMRFAARLGLSLVDYRPLAVRYETPFFETNALAAAGVFTPADWRRGDLAVFRQVRTNARLDQSIGRYRRNWVEVQVGRMRLFIKPEVQDAGGLQGLIPWIDGDVLPSVSRRDPRRRLARVWTSGNRVFRTDNPELVLDAAFMHSKEGSMTSFQPRLWGTVHQRGAVERVRDKLRALAAIEAAEEAASPIGAEEGAYFGGRVRRDFGERRQPPVLADLFDGGV